MLFFQSFVKFNYNQKDFITQEFNIYIKLIV